MYAGQYIFTQIMDHLPWYVFRRCVARYDGDHKIKRFSCHDQFHCFAFAQLTWRESLRDIEACLKTQSSKLYHLGFRNKRIARNTMSNANAVRDWRIYADFAQHLLGIHLSEEMKIDNAIVSVDGLELKDFDYIDIGTMLPTSGAVPVVIKSLIFPTTAALGQDWKAARIG